VTGKLESELRSCLASLLPPHPLRGHVWHGDVAGLPHLSREMFGARTKPWQGRWLRHTLATWEQNGRAALWKPLVEGNIQHGWSQGPPEGWRPDPNEKHPTRRIGLLVPATMLWVPYD